MIKRRNNIWSVLISKTGTKVSSAKVTIDEVDYPVTPARYTGATPLSALVLNTMQDNIEAAIEEAGGSVIVSATEPTGADRERVWLQTNIVNMLNEKVINATINGDGSLLEDNTRLCFDYIQVTPSSNITFSVNTRSDVLGIAFYDDEKEFISRAYLNMNTSVTGTVPSTAKYARPFVQVSMYDPEIELDVNSISEYEMQLEDGEERTTYEALVENKIYVLNDNDIYEEFSSSSSSEEIIIGEPSEVTNKTKIFINEEEGTDAYSEVVNSLAGDEIAKAPSVHAVNEALLDVYSTTEQKIGTWIDGKPLYRKTFDITTPSTANTNTVIQNTFVQNLDKVIDIRGIIHSTVYNTYAQDYIYYGYLINYNYSTNFNSTVYYDNGGSGGIRFKVSSDMVDTPATVIIEYTKTTDV